MDATKVDGGLDLNGQKFTSKKIINHKIRTTNVNNVWFFLRFPINVKSITLESNSSSFFVVAVAPR